MRATPHLAPIGLTMPPPRGENHRRRCFLPRFAHLSPSGFLFLRSDALLAQVICSASDTNVNLFVKWKLLSLLNAHYPFFFFLK